MAREPQKTQTTQKTDGWESRKAQTRLVRELFGPVVVRSIFVGLLTFYFSAVVAAG